MEDFCIQYPWKSMIEQQATDDNIIWCMHFACYITKATETHSEYVASPRHQWFHELTSVSRSACIACLVKYL